MTWKRPTGPSERTRKLLEQAATLRKAGHTWPEIAETLGVTVKSLDRATYVYDELWKGLCPPGKARKRKPVPTEKTRELLKRAAAIVAAGHSLPSTADTLGVKLETLRGYRRRYKPLWTEYLAQASDLVEAIGKAKPDKRPLLPAVPVWNTCAGEGSPEMTLADFYTRCYQPIRLIGKSEKTRQDYRSQINRFCAWAGRPIKVGELCDELVADYLAFKLQEGRSVATVNHARRSLSALWRFARRKKLVEGEPTIEPLRQPKREVEAWSTEEYGRILQVAAKTPGNVDGVSAADWWVALLLVDYDTGLRIGALMQLERKDLDAESGWIFVPAEVQKQLADQRFRLHPDTLRAVRKILGPEPGPLFPWPHTSKTLSRAFAGILERAGVPYGHARGDVFHKIRRTSATYVAEKLGIGGAQEHLGHSCQSVTRRYVDRSKIQRIQVTDVLPRPAFPSPDPGE